MGDTVSLKSFVPMATSLAFGVLFGTLISLFLVPCLYLILEDVLEFTQNKRRGPQA
jgi:multidrug efflux pump subunit AcrB